MFAANSVRTTLYFLLALFLGGCGYVQFVGELPEEDAQIFQGSGSLLVLGSAADSEGNHYLVGRVEGVVDLGTMELRAGVDETAFALSFSPDGEARWVQTWSGGFALATSVDVRDERVVVTGYVRGTIVGPIPLVTGGRQELVVFDFDRETGAPVPPPLSFSSPSGNVQGKSVASAGAVSMLCGHYVGSVDLGLGSLPTTPVDRDFGFVAVFDSSGRTNWAEAVVGANVFLNAAFVRTDGSAVAAGVYRGGTLGGRDAVAGDGVVVGFAGDGTVEFELGVGSIGNDEVVAAAAYEDGAVVVGTYQGELSIGGLALAAHGETDAFVARLGHGGEVVWARSLEGTSQESVRDVRVDGGRIFVAGEFDGDLRFSGETLRSAGGADAMVVVFDADGDEVAAQQLGGVGNERLVGLEVEGGRAWLALVLDGETQLDESGPREGLLGLRTITF